MRHLLPRKAAQNQVGGSYRRQISDQNQEEGSINQSVQSLLTSGEPSVLGAKARQADPVRGTTLGPKVPLKCEGLRFGGCLCEAVGVLAFLHFVQKPGQFQGG